MKTDASTIVSEIETEAFKIIELVQWHRRYPRKKELVLIGRSLWTIAQKLVTLRRML